MYWTCPTNTRSQINLILIPQPDASPARSVSKSSEPAQEPFNEKAFTVMFMQILDNVLLKFPGSPPVVDYILHQLHPKGRTL